MHPLDRKLFRDLGSMKGQMIAVALVMSCGLAVMIMARSLIHSLDTTRQAYYSKHRFAEVFCNLKRAPNSLRERLARIDGVAALETRVTGSAVLEIPGMNEPADGTILSLPDDRPQQLNLLYLRSGRLPETGGKNEVAVGEAFAKAHGFQPGDTIDATIRGSRERLTITGIVLSPEYVFESRPGDTMPDNRRFGVFWMNEHDLSIALDLDGAFNNVAVDLAPGASERGVMAELDRLLEPYGGLIAYGRDDHPSALRLDDELRILRGFAVAFPAIFLGIAAFMTSAALSRLVRLQREQIAQLKAFGYSSAAVGWHYMKFALVIVALATVVGSGLGLLLATAVVDLYHRFFLFPSLTLHPDWWALVTALTISTLVVALGVSGSVRLAVKLAPAEAMRPEPPAEFKPTVLERMGLAHLASPSFRMALRNIERKPWQSLFTTLGLALATAIPIVPGSMRDGVAYLMDFQWSLVQRQTVTLGLVEAASPEALDEMRHLPGVMDAEPYRSVPARMLHGHIERRVGITGIPRNPRLNRQLDERGNVVELPSSGLLVSAKLAEIMNAKPGDVMRIEVQEGRRPVLEIPIGGTITDYAGVAAYMDIDELRRAMREGRTVSGANLTVDRAHWDDFLESVNEAPAIASLAITQSARESFRKSTGEMMNTIQGIYFGFAVIVAFGVVYNGARIALSERGRDLATLRVVGFTHREVAGVLIGELAMLTLFAIPLGLAIGSGLAKALVAGVSTETVRMPLVLTAKTFATAMLIVLVSSTVSFAVVSRRIKNLDLIGVLKARD
ncbi:FtsX-like permease family protein [Luteolibacter pohnpeiensis]|uniref:FtsX-like permease family protein n=1 Tax=Luteolibacter pohnpeiensis TaxID=454153 RepID=A0A934S7D1_9BACT|nr:FtsX-like permease family protein [Luteolibacter pohnpeiensis]MBK1883562.1 FtsX-like permease family protein [Luteolibacter pohnpeiensis]